MAVRHTTVLGLVLCILLLHSPAFAQLALPANLHVAPVYLDFVEAMADRSPTFDTQLRRIARAPGVTVYVDVVPQVIGARARTRMVKRLDELTAWIEVARFENLVELIAHEIEHVIEQIERINLQASAGVSGSGIYAVSANKLEYETARAASAGVAVAREVRQSRSANVTSDKPEMTDTNCLPST